MPNQTKTTRIICCLSNRHSDRPETALRAFPFLLPPQQDSVLSSYLCALTVVLCGKIIWLVKIWSKGSTDVISVLCGNLAVALCGHENHWVCRDTLCLMEVGGA